MTKNILQYLTQFTKYKIKGRIDESCLFCNKNCITFITKVWLSYYKTAEVRYGKLVGAVTHVFINDPTRGYGIFIENMLAEAEKIK